LNSESLQLLRVGDSAGVHAVLSGQNNGYYTPNGGERGTDKRWEAVAELID
jgi:hypothetical protein